MYIKKSLIALILLSSSFVFTGLSGCTDDTGEKGPQVSITTPDNLADVNGNIAISGTYTGTPQRITGSFDDIFFTINFSEGSWTAQVDTAALDEGDPKIFNGIHAISVIIEDSTNTDTDKILITVNNGADYTEPEKSHVSGTVELDEGFSGYTMSTVSPLYICAVETTSEKQYFSNPITSGIFPFEFTNVLNLPAGTYDIGAFLDLGNNGPDENDLTGEAAASVTVDGTSSDTATAGTIAIGETEEITGEEGDESPLLPIVSGTVYLPDGVTASGELSISFVSDIGISQPLVTWPEGSSMAYSIEVFADTYRVTIVLNTGSEVYYYSIDDRSFAVDADISYDFYLILDD